LKALDFLGCAFSLLRLEALQRALSGLDRVLEQPFKPALSLRIDRPGRCFLMRERPSPARFG
jgi:hypothetical protein